MLACFPASGGASSTVSTLKLLLPPEQRVPLVPYLSRSSAARSTVATKSASEMLISTIIPYCFDFFPVILY